MPGNPEELNSFELPAHSSLIRSLFLRFYDDIWSSRYAIRVLHSRRKDRQRMGTDVGSVYTSLAMT